MEVEAVSIAAGREFGLHNLWILGWYIYSIISTSYCMLLGAGLYGFITTIQGGDVVSMYDKAIELCYAKMNEYY